MDVQDIQDEIIGEIRNPVYPATPVYPCKFAYSYPSMSRYFEVALLDKAERQRGRSASATVVHRARSRRARCGRASRPGRRAVVLYHVRRRRRVTAGQPAGSKVLDMTIGRNEVGAV